jgi:hypothetical protein
MLTRIKPLYFFLSFGIGLLLVYFLQPSPKVVLKFPSPFNAGQVTYREDDSCYKYNATKVDCPEDGVKPQPLFESFAWNK